MGAEQAAPIFTDDMTLGEARNLLRQYVQDGHACPLCLQFAKVYKRTITSRMAHQLIEFWKTCKREFGHLPTVIPNVGGGDFAKLANWGLVEPKMNEGEQVRGWWRITGRGESWLADRITVEKYAHVYDGRCLSLRGEGVHLRDALGKRFNYEELMADVVFPDAYGQDTLLSTVVGG